MINPINLRNIAKLLAPWLAIRRLERSNQRLSSVLENPFLEGINIGRESGIEVGMKGSGPQLLAGMFLGLLEKDGKNAPNYLELTFGSPKGPILVTVTQPRGASPDTLRRQAESKAAQLEADLQALIEPEEHF